ncbi:nuclear transport factor 2 family protein [Sphingomonas sp. HF-S3]|uniref:Nuclear transport factor 2 family protein n=1 Tax=Sphingomonas rustica TaxID=3103142 RepID=A0ABV0BBT5_9SPHN
MRHLLLAAALLAPGIAAAQTTPTPKLPPANPLPYDDPDAAAVMAPIAALTRAIAERDGQAALALVKPEGIVTVVEQGEAAPRITHQRWSDWAKAVAPGPERFEERLSTPAIEVDGDLAMVWVPYVFLIDGRVSHCGTNHADLVREGGSWRIVNLSWTQRKTGCPA